MRINLTDSELLEARTQGRINRQKLDECRNELRYYNITPANVQLVETEKLMALRNKVETLYYTINSDMFRRGVNINATGAADSAGGGGDPRYWLDACCVCQDPLNVPDACAPCGHVYCDQCIRDMCWNYPCPQCKVPITHTIKIFGLNGRA